MEHVWRGPRLDHRNNKKLKYVGPGSIIVTLGSLQANNNNNDNNKQTLLEDFEQRSGMIQLVF